MSKPLDAGVSELRRSFSVLSKAAEDGITSPHFLLLFYAVECGLKARILRKFDKWKLSHINKDMIDIYTHDLSYLAKKAGITVEVTGLHLKRSKSLTIEIEKVHEAWRYGIEIAVEDQKNVVKYLKKL
ncbi:MAG: hypothetical protein DRI57_09390 [Deltaproteobacteria bacterium]|nr:MAG: hypothetical protein DRI57_09390 [Deltaproteobacteria bacterium]